MYITKAIALWVLTILLLLHVMFLARVSAGVGRFGGLNDGVCLRLGMDESFLTNTNRPTASLLYVDTQKNRSKYIIRQAWNFRQKSRSHGKSHTNT